MNDLFFDDLHTEDTIVHQPANEDYETFNFEEAFSDSADHFQDGLTAQGRILPNTESDMLDLDAKCQANPSQTANNVGKSYPNKPAGERAKPAKSTRSRKSRTRNPASDFLSQRKVPKKRETSKRSRSKPREREIAVADKERLIQEAMAREKAASDERHFGMMRATPSENIGLQYEYVEGVLQVQMPANNPFLSPQRPANIPEAIAAFDGNRAHWNTYDM
jgi:hypothetical protein